MSSELKVGDVMTKNVIVIDKGSPLSDAAKMMRKHDVGSIVVVDGKSAVGIITERDVIHKVIAAGKDVTKLKVDEVMSRPLRVVKPTAGIEDAAKAMKGNKVKRLPVINEKKELIGILSEGDIARLLPSIVDLIEERDLAK
ncbi:Inosine-5'-monophosphate dehydrogenase [uncultured archaeon]|nr:Inosine-5'-monophosphate dehydrogenase [uncultured archaeon]